MSEHKVHFVASSGNAGRTALGAMEKRYGQHPLEDATVIVALGGDGFMLQTLHQVIDSRLPVYGMKIGKVGFLMNRFVEEGLEERLDAARVVELNPLQMRVRTEAGTTVTAIAINEVSLLRQTNQAAHIRILVNDMERVPELVCDGVLVATAAGSTAYNSSVRGPILPIGTDAMALTPISPFRPRRWSGAILPGNSQVQFEILDHLKRPVSATADAFEVRNITRVDIRYDKHSDIHLMFDPDHSLEERILNEQFL